MGGYFNAARVAQVAGMRGQLREDGLGASEYLVLLALAARMATKTIPGTLTIADSCFPALSTIAEESMLGGRAVRYALAELAESGYISKTPLPGWKLKGRPGNQWDGVRYMVGPRWLTGSMVSAEDVDADTDCPEPSEEDLDGLESLDSSTCPTGGADDLEPAEPGPRRGEDFDRVLALIRERLSDHPTMLLTDPVPAMRVAVDAFLACADVVTVLDTLSERLTPEMVESLMRKTNLGGYLRSCAPQWVRSRVEALGQEILRLAIVEDVHGYGIAIPGSREAQIPTVRRWIAERLADDLSEWALTKDDDGLLRLHVEVSEPFRAQYLEDCRREEAEMARQ